MEGAEVHRLVGEVIGVDDDCRDREVLVAAVATVARLQAWLDGRNVRLAARLAEVAARPGTARGRGGPHLGAGRRPGPGPGPDRGGDPGVGRSARRRDRCRAAMSTPWGGSCASWNRATGTRLAASAGWLVKLASTSTPGELHKALTVELDQLRAEDGMSRLVRQRRATRLDTWIDDEGMWCLRGRFDPETGLTLQGRLANTVAALFADKTPDDCPFHPLERQAFLRAHALAALTEGHGAPQRPSRRSSPSSTSPIPSPTGHRPSTGGSPSSCPPRCCAACSTPPTSTRSSCAAALSSTPPAASTWAAPPGWPTGPNAAPCAPSTARAPSPAATPATTSASSTTSSGGNTAAPPTWPTSCPCASDTTTPCTTTAGTWCWPPTGP